MAKNIYSFIKIERKQTRMGIYVTLAGIISMICLLILLVASSFMKGGLPPYASGIGYLSFIAALLALNASIRLWQDSEAYGPFVHTSIYVNLAAVGVHALIFLIGCFSLLI